MSMDILRNGMARAWLVGAPLPAGGPALAPESPTYARLVRRAQTLVLLGLAWHATEAVLTMLAGIDSSSLSLLAFGGDVTAETIGGLVVLWRLNRTGAPSQSAELLAQPFVAVLYWLIAVVVVFEATTGLLAAERPDESMLGITLAVLALIVMPLLRDAKGRVGLRLGSIVVRREGMQNMLCAYLSLALLVGLTANALLGWWWADAVAAYVIAVIAVVGGRRAWQTARCCGTPPGSGLVLSSLSCDCDPTAASCCAVHGERDAA
jgi:divalent metal cation (Fe/Co/Zn/Cd) transporter